MKVTEIALRYSKAFYELAKEANCVEKVLSELKSFCDLLEQSSELKDLFANPVLEKNAKIQILESLSEKLKLSEQSSTFLQLLLEKKRILHANEVTHAMEVQSDKDNAITRVQVVSSETLPESVKNDVKEEIGNLISGQTAVFDYSKSPDLIGGVIAKLEGLSVDGTLLSKLKTMKEDLLKT